MKPKDHRLIEDEAEKTKRAELSSEESEIVKNLHLLTRARKELGGELARDIGRTLAESIIAYSKKKKLTRLAVKPSGRSNDEDDYLDWRTDLCSAFDESFEGAEDSPLMSLQRGEGGKLSFMPLDLWAFFRKKGVEPRAGRVVLKVDHMPFAQSIGSQQEAENLLGKYGLLLENEENWRLGPKEKEGKKRKKNEKWWAETFVPIEIKAGSYGKKFKVETCWPIMKRVLDDYAEIESRYSKLPLEIRKRLGGWRP